MLADTSSFLPWFTYRYVSPSLLSTRCSNDRELLRIKNGNPFHFFMSGEATPKGAVSTFDKMYRQVFKAAQVNGTSHMFRHKRLSC